MKESKDGEGMANGGGGGSVFDIAMEEMTHEEEGEDEEKRRETRKAHHPSKQKQPSRKSRWVKKGTGVFFNTCSEPHRAPGANFA